MTPRRKFLQMLGFGAAAPAVLPRPVEVLDDLEPRGVTMNALARPSLERHGPINTEFFKKRLADMLDPRKRELRRMETEVLAFDPDVHALRSVSLSAKVLIQRERTFERTERNRKYRYEGILAGWWGEDD